MRRIVPCGAAIVLLSAPGPAGAGAGFLGGFRPVAAEESARALWVNPASIGARGVSTVTMESVWRETFESWRGFSVAAATDRFAYGFQKERDDVPGVADWTLGFGARTQGTGAFRFGWAAEWRGGEENRFDGSAGFDYRLSGALKASLAVADLFESDTDGVPTSRTWRPGVALRSRALKGRFTYDAVLRDGEDRHWFGLGFDRTGKVRASVAVNTDGDWNVTADLVLPRFLAGGGFLAPESGDDRTWLAVDWIDRQSRALPGARSSSRSAVDMDFRGFLPSPSPFSRETP